MRCCCFGGGISNFIRRGFINRRCRLLFIGFLGVRWCLGDCSYLLLGCRLIFMGFWR